jgi:hypothetical protein
VNPTPAITGVTFVRVCSNSSFIYNINSNVTGATFVWSRPAVPGISNPAVSGQTSSTISETLINTTNSAINVDYTITPAANGCTGTAFTYTAIVSPRPAVTSVASGSVCGSNPFTYPITSNVTGATFSWSRAAVTGISNAATSAQTTNPITETLVNTTTAPIDVTYTITPSFNNCAGTPFTYTMTVNPTPVISSATSGGVAVGSLSATRSRAPLPAPSTPGAAPQWPVSRMRLLADKRAIPSRKHW